MKKRSKIEDYRYYRYISVIGMLVLFLVFSVGVSGVMAYLTYRITETNMPEAARIVSATFVFIAFFVPLLVEGKKNGKV